MSFYLRKYIKAGPLRLNLSKGGLGISGGVKGARVGVGPKGAYVHGGRHGLYYRKYASAKGKSSKSRKSPGEEISWFVDTGVTYGERFAGMENSEPTPPALPAASSLWLAGIILGALLLIFGYGSTGLMVTGGILCGAGAAVYWKTGRDKNITFKTLESLRKGLESKRNPRELLDNHLEPKIGKGFRKWLDFHFFVLFCDKFFEDPDYITPDNLQLLEHQLEISPKVINQIKIAAFSTFLDEVMEDHVITKEEEEQLKRLQENLNLSDSDLEGEKKVIETMCSMRDAMADPLTPKESELNLKKGEECYYRTEGRMLKEKVMNSFQRNLVKHKEIGYDIDMEGNIFLTSKRILLAGNGSRSYELSKILDVTLSIEDHTVNVTIDNRKNPIILTMPDIGTFAGKLKNAIS